MSTSTSGINFRGARGSNTGDQFHELWALQQALELLRHETDLKAIGIEGVRTEAPSKDGDSPVWDGVDCALYRGGTTLQAADQVEFVQLKYSAANPEISWSVARLSTNTAKKGSNSVIRKMAEAFKGAKAGMKHDAKLKIRFISNQSLAARLREALEARWSGPFNSADIDQAAKEDLKSLSKATGIALAEFQDFLETLDFSECGACSRFAIKQRVIETTADLLGDDVSSEIRELQSCVRQLMMPEHAGQIVTERDVLGWFGLAGREGLFPCPPDIKRPERSVQRPATDEAVRLLNKGERLILVHGAGGCGKTTLMLQIAELLPSGSAAVFFDCFGGGRYVYSNDKRHLPENAFLHLANELAVKLGLPLFIPRSSKYPATVQSFLAKIRLAGDAVKQLNEEGLLLIVIDAADNCVAGAEIADPPERAFVYDLFGASLSDLPGNVHIIASCRTARRASLRLPSHTPQVTCPPFSVQETRRHLEMASFTPSDSLVEQFHSFSKANPRVQAHAISAAKGDQTRLLKALLPGGKSLPDVLKLRFDDACPL